MTDKEENCEDATEEMDMNDASVEANILDEMSGSNSRKMNRFVVRKWDAYALWSWDVVVDSCAICRNLIMDSCIECQAEKSNYANENCSIAWGVCNHAFHYHCISRWLKSRRVCPLDNTEWIYQKYRNYKE